MTARELKGDGYVLRPSSAGEPRHLRVRHFSPAVEELLRAPEPAAVEIVEHFEDRGGGVEFLARFPEQIRALWVGPAGVPGLAAVNGLHRLTRLSLTGNVAEIDFGRLPHLRECTLIDAPELGGVRDAGALEELRLVNPAIRDLRGLSALRGLRSLSLDEPRRLASLEGIEELPLEAVDLGWPRALRSVAPLAGLRALRSLSLRGGKAIGDFERVGEIATLQSLQVGPGPSVPSFEWVAGLRDLRTFWIAGMKVLASPASVAPFASLPDLRVLKLFSGVESSPDLERLGEIRSLEVLMIERGAGLPSLEFLRGLPRLEQLLISRTPVEAGGIDVLLELPSLKRLYELTPHRKHFRQRAAEVAEILCARHPEPPPAV